jgi:hypothetical protein
MTLTEPPLRVELFVRSLAPSGSRSGEEVVVERLQRLEADGVVDDLTVHVTGKQVCPGTATADTEPGRFLLGRLAAFERWADRTGRSLKPFFEHVEGAETIDGTDCSGIRFPAIALATYRGDELVAVAPVSDGAAVESVSDRLDALERARGDATAPLAGRAE